ncbi:MAG: CRISPR-associated protein Cas4 [Magnetospirillum sp.]|nr:CRISPR-associated protein Cas4 [Magnetospirillum sp.]
MNEDEDLIPLSALQHWLVCPRQCALIHLEQQWSENAATAEGKVLHARVDSGGSETRGTVRSAWGLPLRSTRLGLSGKADLVEFHRHPDGSETPVPVEHKRGRPKDDDRDRVQLCAQALCLEEMLGVAVPAGALFYHATRRRDVIALDQPLRRRTEDAAAAVRALIASGRTPPPVAVPACGGCSLANLCLPTAAAPGRRVADYFQRELAKP